MRMGRDGIHGTHGGSGSRPKGRGSDTGLTFSGAVEESSSG